MRPRRFLGWSSLENGANAQLPFFLSLHRREKRGGPCSRNSRGFRMGAWYCRLGRDQVSFGEWKVGASRIETGPVIKPGIRPASSYFLCVFALTMFSGGGQSRMRRRVSELWSDTMSTAFAIGFSRARPRIWCLTSGQCTTVGWPTHDDETGVSYPNARAALSPCPSHGEWESAFHRRCCV